MSTPDITFEVLGGTEAAEHGDELQALHGEVYAAPPYGAGGDAAGSPAVSGSSAASRVSSWLRPATAATWWATRPGSRSARQRPGGGT